jgi:N-acetylglucosamine-6-phosphate deacetylase
MGIYDRKGSLDVDKDADCIIMNENLELLGVISMGQEVEI